MYQVLAKIILGRLLTSPDTKKRIVDALREEAKGTTTKLDDEAVDVFEVIWDVAVSALFGKVS